MSLCNSELRSRKDQVHENCPVTALQNDNHCVGTVIVVSSGKSRSISMETEDTAVLREVCFGLTAIGFHCVNPTLPIREDGLNLDDADLILLRLGVIAAALDTIHGNGPVVILAMSLGVQTALLMAEDCNLADRIDALVLLSCVIERPIAPIGKIRSIDLVYGSRDYVGYLDDSCEQLQAISPPEEYGKQSLARLVLAPGQDSGLHLIRGAGHTLHTRRVETGNDSAAAVAFIQNLIVSRVAVAAPID